MGPLTRNRVTLEHTTNIYVGGRGTLPLSIATIVIISSAFGWPRPPESYGGSERGDFAARVWQRKFSRATYTIVEPMGDSGLAMLATEEPFGSEDPARIVAANAI